MKIRGMFAVIIAVVALLMTSSVTSQDVDPLQPKLVSEGYWYWHPGEKQIKGLFTAIEMPVVLFEYTTRFEGNTMVNDLKTFAANGSETIFAETWEFVDDTHFEWKLTSELSDGTEAMMSGTYVRINPPR